MIGDKGEIPYSYSESLFIDFLIKIKIRKFEQSTNSMAAEINL